MGGFIHTTKTGVGESLDNLELTEIVVKPKYSRVIATHPLQAQRNFAKAMREGPPVFPDLIWDEPIFHPAEHSIERARLHSIIYGWVMREHPGEKKAHVRNCRIKATSDMDMLVYEADILIGDEKTKTVTEIFGVGIW